MAADSLITLSDDFIARLHSEKKEKEKKKEKEEGEEGLTLVGLADCASGACPIR